MLAAVVLVMVIVRPDSSRISQMRIDLASVDPVRALFQCLLLGYQPYCFDILPLYVVILAMAPVFLWLLKHKPLMGFWISLNIYFVGQSGINLPKLDGQEWFYNPFSWQLMFILGMAASVHHAKLKCGLLNWRAATVAFLLFVGLTLVVNSSWSDILGSLRYVLLSKGNAGILRLLHFVLLAIPMAWILNRFHWLTENPISRCLSVCGRNSFTVFLLGVVLTYTGSFILRRGEIRPLFAYECFCFGVLVMAPVIRDALTSMFRGDRVPTS